jgi:hypothetical protein
MMHRQPAIAHGVVDLAQLRAQHATDLEVTASHGLGKAASRANHDAVTNPKSRSHAPRASNSANTCAKPADANDTKLGQRHRRDTQLVIATRRRVSASDLAAHLHHLDRIEHEF